jgi:hypothetical protein
MGLADKIVDVESGGDPNAKNPNSSAGGAGQFIDSTWLDMLAKHRPDITGTDDQKLALKSDPDLSKAMTAAYAADNAGLLNKAGVPVTPGTQYLAHFAGPQGAIGILNADPNAPAASVLGSGFAKANPSLAGYTAGQLASWAERKMGGSGSPAPMAMAGPAAASASAAPAPAPVRPQAPQTQQAAPQQAAPASPPVDLAALAAVPQAKNFLSARPNPFGLVPLTLNRG